MKEQAVQGDPLHLIRVKIDLAAVAVAALQMTQVTAAVQAVKGVLAVQTLLVQVQVVLMAVDLVAARAAAEVAVAVHYDTVII